MSPPHSSFLDAPQVKSPFSIFLFLRLHYVSFLAMITLHNYGLTCSLFAYYASILPDNKLHGSGDWVCPPSYNDAQYNAWHSPATTLSPAGWERKQQVLFLTAPGAGSLRSVRLQVWLLARALLLAGRHHLQPAVSLRGTERGALLFLIRSLILSWPHLNLIPCPPLSTITRG